MVMKFLDFLQLPIMQLVRKFFLNILINGGDKQSSGTDPGKIANSRISIIAKKVANIKYSANFFCSVMLFDAFYHNY